jgi:peroxiredoxin
MSTAAPPSPSLPPRAYTFAYGLLGVVGLVLALNVSWLARNCGDLRALGPGQQAPDFELPSLGGDRVRLSDLRGRVVLVEFWSLGCPACVQSLPELRRLAGKLKDRPFTLLAVHLRSRPGHRQALTAFAEEAGLQFPILLDDGSAGDAYRVRLMPTTVLVDPRGQIRKVWRGVVSESTLRRAILAQLPR